MKEPIIEPETVSRASVRTHKRFKTVAGVILTLSLINALASHVAACGVNDSFDVTCVSDVTAEELHESAPDWCNEDMCNLIVDLSQKHGISSEFALSVFRYEFVPERNSVGGVKGANGYYNYTSIVQTHIATKIHGITAKHRERPFTILPHSIIKEAPSLMSCPKDGVIRLRTRWTIS